jgi:hypothetical protein
MRASSPSVRMQISRYAGGLVTQRVAFVDGMRAVAAEDGADGVVHAFDLAPATQFDADAVRVQVMNLGKHRQCVSPAFGDQWPSSGDKL